MPETIVKPEGCILEWISEYGFYKASLVNKAITLAVIDKRDPVKQQGVTRWAVVVGNYYWSDRTEHYFSNPEAAMITAERVALKVAEKLVETLKRK